LEVDACSVDINADGAQRNGVLQGMGIFFLTLLDLKSLDGVFRGILGTLSSLARVVIVNRFLDSLVHSIVQGVLGQATAAAVGVGGAVANLLV